MAGFDETKPARTVVTQDAEGRPMVTRVNLTPDEIAEYQQSQLPEPGTPEKVNSERDRRIAAGTELDITGVGNVPISGTDDDQRNLQALGLGAFIRVQSGDNQTVTIFRDRENATRAMTPAQVLELWQKAAAYVSAVYAASWSLKAANPIPSDFRDDKYWP